MVLWSLRPRNYTMRVVKVRFIALKANLQRQETDKQWANNKQKKEATKQKSAKLTLEKSKVKDKNELKSNKPQSAEQSVLPEP